MPRGKLLDCSLDDLIAAKRRRRYVRRDDTHNNNAVPYHHHRLVDPMEAAERSALNDTIIEYPPIEQDSDGNPMPSRDNALIVNFKGTAVITVRRSNGDLVLDSGGWRTLSTKLLLNHALKPIGLKVIEEISNNDKVWQVVDEGNSFLKTFQDGMIISSTGPKTSRTLTLARASIIQQHLSQLKFNVKARGKK